MMETKNLVGMILAVTVGLICIGTIMMPILSEATTTDETLTNDGLYRMEKYGTDAEITAVWDYTNPGVITINDEEVELPEQSGSTYLMTIVGDSSTLLRYGYVSTNNIGVQLFDDSQSGVKLQASVSTETSMTITVSGGSVIYTNGTDTVTETYSESLFMASPDGSYVMKKSTDSVYMLEDTVYYGIGRSIISSSGSNTAINLYVEGTIGDGFEVTPLYSSPSITVSDETVNATALDGYVDAYAFTGVSFTVTSGGSETDLVYSQIIVPYQVTAELSSHFDSTQIAIIMVIPVLMIIAVLLVAVRGLTRYD